MDESDCKLLTTFLGECWHEKPEESYHRQARKRFFLGHICGKCGKAYLNRTFTTPDDMMEVFHKLVEINKWANFKWHENTVRQWDLDETNLVYSDWLFYNNPTRFCQLAADFLKENKP